MNFVIKGRIPSKKNSINIVCTGRFPRKFPSNQYLAWHKDAVKQVEALRLKSIKFSLITITVFAPDRRAGDLTNKAESIMDLMVDCGIIPDDNWFVVPELTLCFGGVDKENPRAEIVIR